MLAIILLDYLDVDWNIVAVGICLISGYSSSGEACFVFYCLLIQYKNYAPINQNNMIPGLVILKG